MASQMLLLVLQVPTLDPYAAQDESPSVFEEAAEGVWTAAKTLALDTAYLVAAPLRLNGENLWPTLAALGVIVGSSVLDEPLHRWVVRKRTRNSRKFFDKIGPLGNDAAIELAALAVGAVAGDGRIIEMALTAFEARMFSALLVSNLKSAVGRSRPDSTDSAFEFDPFGGGRSFPRGMW